MWKQSYQLCKKGKLSESMDVKIEEPWLQPFYTLTQPSQQSQGLGKEKIAL